MRSATLNLLTILAAIAGAFFGQTVLFDQQNPIDRSHWTFVAGDLALFRPLMLLALPLVVLGVLNAARSMKSASKRVAVFLFLCAIAVTSSALALREGARAPEIGLPSTSGGTIRIGDLNGKVVLVDFWASWCVPCREELPVLQRLYTQLRSRGFVVVGVNVDSDASNMRSFAQRANVSFPVVHDARRAVADRYRPSTMPSSYIIDRNGVIRHIHRGFRASDASMIERHVRALLDEGAQRR